VGALLYKGKIRVFWLCRPGWSFEIPVTAIWKTNPRSACGEFEAGNGEYSFICLQCSEEDLGFEVGSQVSGWNYGRKVLDMLVIA
jgi:hypothetical protein